MKRHLRAALLSLPFWGAACFGIPDVSSVVSILAGTVTTAVGAVVLGKSSTSDTRLIQSFDRDAKTWANGLEGKIDNASGRFELMIEKVRIETQNDITKVQKHITKVEERIIKVEDDITKVQKHITKVEERIIKVEDDITKVQKHITKVEDDIKDVKDAVEEVKKLLSKPDEPNVFNFLRR